MKIRDREIRTIYDLLDLVRERPGMWISEPSLSFLDVFLFGFSAGVLAAGASFEPEHPRFHDFHAWIATRLNRKMNGRGWRNLLLDECGSEPAALERFWIELDAFRGR
ncbi:MAG: hypothetical protein ACM31C_10460 [Acidobacteriota bacterium]